MTTSDTPLTTLAARLLRDAADFFDAAGAGNPGVDADFAANARTYRAIADQVEADPFQSIAVGSETAAAAGVAARLLRDAARFYDQAGRQTPESWEDLAGTAVVYLQIAALLEADPLATLPMETEPQGPLH